MRFFRSLIIAIGLFLAFPVQSSLTFMGGNDFAHLPKEQIVRLQQGNVTYSRLEINWHVANPSPDVYDWSRIDEQISAAESAGLKVYADFMWAPRYATEGVPSYEEYACSVFDDSSTVTFLIDSKDSTDRSVPLNLHWARRDVYTVRRGGTISVSAPGILANDGDYGKGLQSAVVTVGQRTPLAHGSFILNLDGSLTYTNDGTGESDSFRYSVWGLTPSGAGGIHFARDDYDYCRTPSHINKDEVRKFVKAFIDRYGSRVDYYGMWNEPGLDIYWPAQLPDGPWMVGDYRRFVEEFVKPAVETIHMFDPSAKVVGPECESSGCIRGVFGLEQEQHARWFDIVSFHPYPWDDDFAAVGSRDLWAEAAIWRIDNDFKPAIDMYSAGRPVWASEVTPGWAYMGHSPAKQIEYALGLAKAVYGRPWISVLGGYNYNFWFDNTFFIFAKSTTPRARRRAVNSHEPVREERWP